MPITRLHSQPSRTGGFVRVTLDILLALAIAGPNAQAAESTAPGADAPAEATAEVTAAEQEIIDRIVDLERQIQDLREQLSAASRALLDAELARHTSDSADADGAGLGSTGAKEETVVPESVAVTPPESATESASASQPETAVEADTQRRDGCNTLRLFDTSGDGVISGADRYWRYLRLWIDRNRDGVIQDDEVQHPFDFGIVEISGRLRVFHTDKKVGGDIRQGDRLYFEPLGKKNETGILMVDATRIQRGDGLTLLVVSGPEEGGPIEDGPQKGGPKEDYRALEGLQAFRAGLSLRDASGETTLLNCP